MDHKIVRMRDVTRHPLSFDRPTPRAQEKREREERFHPNHAPRPTASQVECAPSVNRKQSDAALDAHIDRLGEQEQERRQRRFERRAEMEALRAHGEGRFRWFGTGMCGVGRWVKRSTFCDRDRRDTPYVLDQEDRRAA